MLRVVVMEAQPSSLGAGRGARALSWQRAPGRVLCSVTSRVCTLLQGAPCSPRSPAALPFRPYSLICDFFAFSFRILSVFSVPLTCIEHLAQDLENADAKDRLLTSGTSKPRVGDREVTGT